MTASEMISIWGIVRHRLGLSTVVSVGRLRRVFGTNELGWPLREKKID